MDHGLATPRVTEEKHGLTRNARVAGQVGLAVFHDMPEVLDAHGSIGVGHGNRRVVIPANVYGWNLHTGSLRVDNSVAQDWGVLLDTLHECYLHSLYRVKGNWTTHLGVLACRVLNTRDWLCFSRKNDLMRQTG